ncbi:aldehyde dehydrogenase family protein [Stackebrandtia nassauensis]|uniref:Betaine-aldehyde dehydrogenase n=1 Tax=Stackebrandtia nassauensis (strain DSM 44728 / CIP 108903 / NRRL B-16338 / NBRC 102104 / LLR-40K-21) TaxID=446470 RepID=D3Q4P6_STANL|nr:aldehyde dehydrogenase family protein [Stackebrandtia nassauensis]ADD42076.1 Betaine-aldehyde dehydrogenase [Stackebrandtia nassauensis DSM 44728]
MSDHAPLPGQPQTLLFIGGRWTPAVAGGTRDIIDPTTGTAITAVAEADAADVAEAIAAAREAFDGGPWPHTSAAERGAILQTVARLLQRDKQAIAELESRDTGKTLREGLIDVDDVTAVFRYYGELADKDLGRVVDTGNPDAQSRVVAEPVGVCSLIAPWNYPLLQMSWKLAPALAAGNTVVAKPSEVTPLTTLKLVDLLTEAGVPSGVVNLVLGAGDPVGQTMVESDRVDLVSFTGGLVSGRRVAATAAATVKKVALELGGKNPNVVFADADFDAAVDGAVNAAFVHSGQVCSAGTRLILHTDIYDDFLAAVAARADAITLGPGMDPASECGPLVSAAQRDKTETYVAGALAQGARLLAGGRRPDDPALADGYYYRPTVFADCHREMTVVREETFGPILTAERFATEDEAIFLANDTIYGLAGAVWTSDAGRGERIAARLRHGTVWINDFHPYLPQAEWGGFKASGIGRELGVSGLNEYRELKHIYRNINPKPSGWFAQS